MSYLNKILAKIQPHNLKVKLKNDAKGVGLEWQVRLTGKAAVEAYVTIIANTANEAEQAAEDLAAGQEPLPPGIWQYRSGRHGSGKREISDLGSLIWSGDDSPDPDSIKVAEFEKKD